MLDELFHAQSSRWGNIARDHVAKIRDLVFQFVKSVLAFVIKDTNAQENVCRCVIATLEENVKCEFNELGKLLDDEAGCPITYNHYYTDNIQKARNNRSKQDLGTSLHKVINEDWNGRFHVNNSSFDISRLVASLQNHGVIVDMEARACNEAETDLDAYYKVCLLSKHYHLSY